MMRILILLQSIFSFEVTQIPQSKSPPRAMIDSSAVYDIQNDQIITIGGRESSSDFAHSQVRSFNLKTNEFHTIRSTSEMKPSSYEGHFLFLRQDRKIFVFGTCSDVFAFNLDTSSWTYEKISGSLVGNIINAGYSSFNFKGINYVGIFGGITEKGYNNDLYLIDMENLHSTKMKNSGKVPKNRMQCTLAYYNESLYYFGSSSDGEAYDNNLYRYDLNSEEWEVVETIGEKPPPISLHSVFVYNGDMFILFGAIIETQSASNKVNKFNFERKKWSLVSLSAELIRVLSASVLIGSKGYYLYGRDEKGIFNSVYTLDFSQDPIKVQELSKNFLTPTERFSHCAHVINTFMYVFGGTSGYLHDTENIYSDMWRFDLIHKTWEFVTPLGEVPTKRKHFASTKIGGNRFVVFGGENEGGLLNDLYFFHEPYLKWYKISPSGTLIQGRNSACLVSLNNWLFIIGGKSYDKGFNDIWVYNFEDNELKILEVKLTKNNFNSVKCWAQEIEENVAEIIFTGGMDFVSTPSNYTITIRFFNESLSYNATIREVKNTACIIKAKSSSWKQGNKILSFGGHIYNSNMLKPFTLFNLEDNNCDFLEGPSDLNIYDHSIAHFNKSLYIFGGGGKIEHYKTLKIVSNNLFKVEVTDVPNFSLDYSDGFDSTGKLCGKGTYSDKKNCVNCPKGSFSKTLGSSNIDQCIPCPYGTFSSVEGAFNCLDCPNGFKCPIGSIFPHRDIILDYNKSVQPDEYRSDKETILKVNKALWLCFSALLTLLACSLFFYRVVWNYLSCIDVFSKEHNKCLGIPIIYNKTPIGGIFSVIFLLVALVLVISALIGFRMDNLQEYRALIPVVTLKEEIVSDSLSLNISFYIYGGECVKNDSCHPDIHYQDVGLDYLKHQMTCKVTTETCSIFVVYEKMKIVSEKAEIFVNSKEYRSYSSSITINITADSSIPNQISSQMMTFTTSSPDTVFRGYEPSIVSYRFTPSVSLIQVFRSESSKWKEKITGFHISSYEEPKIGSLANYERVNILNGLALKVVLVQSENAMETQRLIKQDWLGFIGSLLGSVFGLMAAFIGVMNLVEKVELVFLKKLAIKRFEKKMLEDFQKRKSEFEDLRLKVKNVKTCPASNSLVPTWV